MERAFILLSDELKEVIKSHDIAQFKRYIDAVSAGQVNDNMHDVLAGLISMSFDSAERKSPICPFNFFTEAIQHLSGNFNAWSETIDWSRQLDHAGPMKFLRFYNGMLPDTVTIITGSAMLDGDSDSLFESLQASTVISVLYTHFKSFNINAKNRFGISLPMHALNLMHDTEMLEYMLEMGADVHDTSTFNGSMLFFINHDHPFSYVTHKVKLLVGLGVNPLQEVYAKPYSYRMDASKRELSFRTFKEYFYKIVDNAWSKPGSFNHKKPDMPKSLLAEYKEIQSIFDAFELNQNAQSAIQECTHQRAAPRPSL